MKILKSEKKKACMETEVCTNVQKSPFSEKIWGVITNAHQRCSKELHALTQSVFDVSSYCR